jgi:hypothetical protein
MKLIIDGNTQEIELSGHASTELSLNRDDGVKLATALLLAWQGDNYADVLKEIEQSKIKVPSI